MRKQTTLLLLSLALTGVGLWVAGCKPGGGVQGAAQTRQRYHCPMHPTYVSDRPGDCPICNMKLVPIKESKAASKSGASAGEDKIAQVKPGQFYCPMGAEHVQDQPGKCPKCGMNLAEKKAASPGGEDAVPAKEKTPPVPGRVSVFLAPEKRQLIGLTLAKVEKRDLTRVIRTTALVEHDETRYARVAPRFAGWVRKLHVNFTGAPVGRGDPLLTVYSPELFAAQNEYLIAWRGLRQAGEGATAAQRDPAQSLLESARLRLELLEFGEEEIRALEQRGRASAEQPFRAPVSGHVVVKNAVEGKAFMAGETLFEIADLDHLWLRGAVAEQEMALVSVGQDAMARFPRLDNRSYPARVTFLYPHLNPQTRRGEIRLELDNPDHLLRPEMWANLEILIKIGEKLCVPASALLDTGTRQVAFLDEQDGHLEPREVLVGAKTDDYCEVVSGLKEGDRVVTRALFLVDSESQLKAAIAGMAGGGEHQH